MNKNRIEHDLLGERQVSDKNYFGIQTLRAHENFKNMSGVQLKRYPVFISSFAMVKYSASRANYDLGLLDKNIFDAIAKACEEIIDGSFHDQFIVDMVQGGAGTSTNMNANEVIANRALEIMGYQKGEYQHCHPNNHVNLSQSTNDTYPTALRIAIFRHNKKLIQDLTTLIAAFRKKGVEFKNIIKMGRTQLQDAVPMTLGQEFESYAVTLEEEVERLLQMASLFLEVNIGATAIGTGINSEPEYAKLCIKYLREMSGEYIKLSSNLIEATHDTGSYIIYSSALKRLAVKLSVICNDLRLLSSGPRCGLNEINLPPMQPGSSIMPGKVNPVIPELLNQVSFKVIGNDLCVTMAAEAGQLQLNAMMPIITQSIFESGRMLEKGMKILTNNCINGITANKKHCRDMVMNSIGIITALAPILGYETTSSLAKEALQTQKSIFDLVKEKKLFSDEEIEQLLLPEKMLSSRMTSKHSKE